MFFTIVRSPPPKGYAPCNFNQNFHKVYHPIAKPCNKDQEHFNATTTPIEEPSYQLSPYS